ncbi:MAG: hypothetical protein H5T97_05540 [Firmicutes bacterium]|nr:hypothetical protein [Bacillota bacterium]
MKIGAGGLQSLAAREALVIRPAEGGGAAERAAEFRTALAAGGAGPAVTAGDELVRAVENLNRAAELFNQRFGFVVREGGRVEVVERGGRRAVAELPRERVVASARELEEAVGAVLNRLV